jgi:hypothetical protein
MRDCPVCASQMNPRFASECEPPVAWSCPECGLLQLESGGREFTAEELEVVRSFEPAPTARRRRVGAGGARTQAREILDALGTELPVDVESLAERLGYPVRWRSLAPAYRGGLEGDPDYRIIVLNRDYPFRSEGERRWAVAEELAHAILGHTTMVASDAPTTAPRLLEPARAGAEAAAKAFAAELLMPAAAVRAAFHREQAAILRALGSDERDRAVRTVIADLAREFRVSQQAMRIRLNELGLLA